jgi:hypothetical protein
LKRARNEPNELIKFLDGTWTTKDITVTPKQEVNIAEYREIMKAIDPETIAITALGIDNGEDVTRDTALKMDRDKVIMSQRDFSARGMKKGNFVSLSGTYQNRVYNFRLYLLEDKYVYQKDVWENDRIVEVQMSYLLRSNERSK